MTHWPRNYFAINTIEGRQAGRALPHFNPTKTVLLSVDGALRVR
jgi:hypothetical protein